ncbi:hypothetical protein MMC20_004004 [Loxospora ochrophaea]|nr:hypothetical protein [Loxospora ochrophaea]
MASGTEATEPAQLTATYKSSNGDKTFQHDLPVTTSTPSTTEKTAYLTTLRSSVVKLQEDVNVFLTKKMDEDKAKGIAASAKSDGQEEQNYGEEVVVDDV